MKITASVDHVEGEWAILMVDGLKVEIPLHWLPKGAQPGSWVNVAITQNHQKEIQVREHVQNLLQELKDGKHLDEVE